MYFGIQLGTMVVNPGAVMELVRNWQGTRVILLVCQFQASLDASLNAELFMSKIWPKLSEFYTAPYCAIVT